MHDFLWSSISDDFTITYYVDVIGNSSSFVRDAGYFGTPVVLVESGGYAPKQGPGFPVMLNFVATFLIEYLTTGPWNDVMAGEAITRLIPDAATLPMLSVRAGSHVGIFIALAMAGVVWASVGGWRRANRSMCSSKTFARFLFCSPCSRGHRCCPSCCPRWRR